MPRPDRTPDRRSPGRSLPRRGFLGRPTLGGWLTILNCCVWAAMQYHIHYAQPPMSSPLIGGVVIVAFFVVSFPLATVIWLPTFHHPSFGNIVFVSVVTGLNAYVWGYGLAKIVRLSPRRRPPMLPNPPAAPTPPDNAIHGPSD